MSTRGAEPDQASLPWLRYARLSLPDNATAHPPHSPLPAHWRPRLSALIYHNLHRNGQADELPEPELAALQRESIETISIQGLYRNWITGFGKRLAEQGLQAVLLKGSAFNGWLYPNDAPRHSVDVDLLVHPDDFDRACALMEVTHQPELLDQRRKATHERLFERVFTPAKPGLPTVEIHRDLTNPYLYRVDIDALISESQPHPGYRQTSLRILSARDNLLNLALHASRDRDFADYGLLDAHELWCQAVPDAREVLDRAREWQACTALYLMLENAATHLDTPVPASLLDALRPSGWRRRLAAATARLDPARHHAPAGRLWQMGANFALSDHLANALRFQWDYAKMRLADLGAR